MILGWGCDQKIACGCIVGEAEFSPCLKINDSLCSKHFFVSHC